MNRRDALRLAGVGSLGLLGWFFFERITMSQNESQKQRMPVVFIGHGSPMNALAQNSYAKMLHNLGQRIPKPKAILVVSAHWVSRGTWVTHMAQPKTIHDFYGFPEELFAVQYPAPGSPQTAELIKSMFKQPAIKLDESEWGLDHGTWAVLKHMYPNADVPVLQMSLASEATPDEHFKIGQELSSLREKGVLILASGNIVHNLRQISWQEDARAHDWAVEFDQTIKSLLEKRDFKAILNQAPFTAAGKLSVPTAEHYLPLHYILGASDAKDELRFEFEQMQNASISMRCVSFGLSA
jgi:4,5-DOPA dioxygenase extradiol